MDYFLSSNIFLGTMHIQSLIFLKFLSRSLHNLSKALILTTISTYG